MDVTTLALAVDSSQVTSASAALDRFAASGAKAETAATRIAKATVDQGRALNTTLVPGANKAAAAVTALANAQEALGPAAADQMAAARSLGAIEARAEGAAAAMHRLGTEAQTAAAKTQAAMRVPARAASTSAAGESVSLAPITGDASALYAVAAAAARADAQVTALGSTLRRDVASGAAAAKASIVDLSTATTSLGASAFVDFDKVTTSLGATAAKAGEAAREVNALRREIALTGPLASATTSMGAQVGPSTATFRERILAGGTSDGDRAALASRLAGVGAVAATANAAGSAAGKAGQQIAAMGKAGQMSAFQMQQLSFQMNDFFVQVASGGSPLTALIQQGSQLSGTFGGMGNAVRAVTSLITPMRLAVGGAAAAVIGLAVAFNEGEKRSKAFRDAILLSGNFAGQTEGRFNALARTVAESTDSSVLKVRELGQALLSTGEIGPQVFDKALAASVGFGEATGQTAEQVAKSFAQMARSPSKFAAEANRQLNFITAAQYDLIKSLEDSGRATEAQALVLDALNQRFPTLKQNITSIDDALSKGQRAFARFWESAFAPTTIDDRIERVRRKLASLPDAAGQPRVAENAGGAAFVGPSTGRSAVGRAALEQQLQDLRETRTRDEKASTARALDAEAQKQAITAKGVIDGYLQRAKAASVYQEKLKDLERQFKARAAVGDPVSAADQAAARAELKKEFTPRGAAGQGEAQQILRAQLEGQMRSIRDTLDTERDALAFQERALQASYQAGESSLADFYARKREAIDRGVQAEIQALDREIQALREYQAKTKDPSEREGAQNRIDDALREQEKARARAANEAELANLQEAASFRQLNEQVLAYRANLLQLQGDEVGAARIRAQIAIEQASVLARQAQPAGRSTGDFARADRGQASARAIDVESLRRVHEQQIELTQVKNQTSLVNQRLQVEEERIATAQRTGAITTLDSLRQVTEVRTRAVSDLEDLVRAQEALAASRPQDYQLQIDTSRARMELERLRGELDPLKLQLDNLFVDAGTHLLTDLMGGNFKDALRNFANTIATEINGVVARELSEQAFGKGGFLEGAGGLLAKVFGKEPSGAKSAVAAAAPSLDTSAVTTSLTNLQAVGIDPAANALVRLEQAAGAAAGAMGHGAGLPPGTVPLGREQVAGVIVGATTGDFSRMDRGQVPTGEQSVYDLFSDAERSAADMARGNALATAAVTQLASAAGKGGGALAMLPGIISAIQASATSSAATSGGSGGIVGSIISAAASYFAPGSGSVVGATGDFARMDRLNFAKGYSAGGWTGDMDPKAPAGIVHGQEVVFSAPAVRAIGKDALLAAHEKAKSGQKPGLFADPGEFQARGIVQRTAAAAAVKGLKPNEVPAVLMGGPRGVREEVLTADDPRHRDNLKPETAAAIFAKAPRYHTGGLAGQQPDRPDLLPVRERRFLTRDEESGESARAKASGKPGGDTHIHVSVTPPSGGTRETAMQWGSLAGRHIRNATRRNG